MSNLGPSRLFIGSTFLVSGLIFGYAVANSVFYYKIRKDGGSSAVSKSKATNMLWISIFVGVISLLLFLWSIWRLVFTKEVRTKIKKTVKEKGKAYLYDEPDGLISSKDVDTLNKGAEDFVKALTPKSASSSNPIEQERISSRISSAQEF